MRVVVAAIAITCLLFLLGLEKAPAVGYERYDVSGASGQVKKSAPPPATGWCDAIKKATFVEKYPAVIDEVVSVIKDVLSQFGLARNRAH